MTPALRPGTSQRLRRFVLTAVVIEVAIAFVTWDVWAALALGHSGSANARIAAAICLAGLVLAVGTGLSYAYEDKL